MHHARSAATCALALLCVLFPLGCGGSSHTGPTPPKKTTHVTLVLDFVPNAVHAGI
jgi:hypothetical protein